jgi:two-component system sensor histidine kinase ChvG
LGDADRLSRLVARLLELARADMVTADETVSTSVESAVRGEGPLPVVSVPQPVLEAVLTTLIENSRQAGAHKVIISGRGEEGFFDLTLCDDGPGVPIADREPLFEPFFTTKRSEGGTGLGLPIARSLLTGSNSAIDFVENGAGACFRLRLKRTPDL